MKYNNMLDEAISLSKKVYLRDGEPAPEGVDVKRGPRGGTFYVPKGSKVYRVGGTVRDELLGMKPKDIDYAVDSPSFDAMRDMITEMGGKIFQEREQFGCIRANVPGLGPADFTLCRKEGFYSDSRHPDSVSRGSILDDLARRDFTVNAIAIDVESGDIVDPHDGRADLKARVLRAVGNPMDRMREDPLRALRAVRFASTKGLVIEPKLKKALKDPEVLKSMKRLPAERMYNELESMFRKSPTSSALALLREYPGISDVIFSKVALKPTLEPDYFPK